MACNYNIGVEKGALLHQSDHAAVGGNAQNPDLFHQKTSIVAKLNILYQNIVEIER